MGFHSSGEGAYFKRVPEMLAQLLGELGHDKVEVHECPTLPGGHARSTPLFTHLVRGSQNLDIWFLEV